MRILFVVPYVPNLIRVRPYNFIRHLAERGHEITVATIWTGEHEMESLKALEAISAQVHAVRLPTWRSILNCARALPTREPLQAVYSWQPELSRRIHHLTDSRNGTAPVDVVHVEHLRGVRYGLALVRRSAGVPVVWDSVDSISLLFRQAVAKGGNPLGRGLRRFELGRTERYEGWLVGQFERILVTSPADQLALESLAGAGGARGRVRVLRNGVDLDYFQPGDSTKRESNTVVLSGKMSYHANVAMATHFVREIMPPVWAARPDVKVLIVGKDPVREVQALGEHPGVTVTGTVEDIRPYLQRAAIAAAPVQYGVGIQNKVLEAMASAAPVIAAPQAISALNVVPGRDVQVAGEPSIFAQALLNLLNDPGQRERLGSAGRTYVEENHDWRVVAGKLEEVYQQAVIARQSNLMN